MFVLGGGRLNIFQGMLGEEEIIGRTTKTESFAEVHCKFKMQVSQCCP